MYTGAAAGYASALVAAAAVVFVVNEELGRDLRLLDLGDVPLTVFAVRGCFVVAALEIECLSSFSVSAIALINSSSAQMRSNLALHVSAPPGQ